MTILDIIWRRWSHGIWRCKCNIFGSDNESYRNDIKSSPYGYCPISYKLYCMTNHDHMTSSRDHLSEFKQKTFNIVTYFQINILFHDAYDTLNILLYSISLFFCLQENPKYQTMHLSSQNSSFLITFDPLIRVYRGPFKLSWFLKSLLVIF